ncbi:hypothetical protein ACI2JI_22625 [Enterobacter cancerogenus]|uniref:hypothetical protein n=1 Tax=Enterobacter cancerogenus TaxID=69218 RepID=UPI00384ACB97
MNKLLVLLAALPLMAGCTTQKNSQKINNYEASVAQCTENGSEIDCDWKNATDDWLEATNTTFKENDE